MLFAKILFFTGLFIIFYSYIGYGILIYLLLKLKSIVRSGKKNPVSSQNPFLPDVTLVTAAYNEEDFIEEKILNALALSYPREKLRIMFITDGSSDETMNIISRFPEVTLLHEPARKGKIAAIHRAMQFVETSFVVFCDANTLLNEDAIKNIVRHYADPKVGGVAGEKKILASAGEKVAGAGEGLYWKYESSLKKLDSELYTVVGAAGELFSIRKELYEYPGDNVLLDDFVISLRICEKGYRVKYEPEAFAMEAPSSSMKEEQKRKIRISAGGFQSMVMLKGLLNIFRFPVLSFQYISHRVLRWAICPFLLPIVFVCNILIWNQDPQWLYKTLMLSQLAFYISALTGWALSLKNIKVKLLYVPYYFFFINYSLYIGFARFLKNKQTVLWDKASRAKMSVE